jgi:hypothetical protein
MRDAIVLSTWHWEMCNVPERIAIALATRGGRVLYCEMPASKFNKRARPLGELATGVHGFAPDYWGAKFNNFAPTRNFQWRLVARQVLHESKALNLKDPLFIYSHIKSVEPLCEEMRAHGLPLVHICMDYPEPYQYAQIALSDRTLVIPETVAHKLKAKFGDKISTIPQSFYLPPSTNGHSAEAPAVPPAIAQLRASGRPILGYLGPLYGRIASALLTQLLQENPQWQFVCFGGAASLNIDNARDMPWALPSQLPAYVSAFDVGLMPYDCFDERNLHCSPLKIFDYFNLGLPVVSTPVLSLREYEGVIYFGETAAELAAAVQRALAEPKDSPKRQHRKEIAQAHTTEVLGRRLEEVLTFTDGRSA